MWCTEEQVRRKLGLRNEEVTDVEITSYITDAQKDMRGDLAYEVSDDTLEGNLSETTFTTTYVNIADRNFDLKINNSDITVYGWVDDTDPASRTILTVSTIYPEYGKVVLVSAPSNYTKITADYFYTSSPTDLTLYPDACAYLAAFYYGMSEIVLMPKQWMHGAYRFLKTEDLPILESEYHKKLIRLRKNVHDVAEMDDVETTT